MSPLYKTASAYLLCAPQWVGRHQLKLEACRHQHLPFACHVCGNTVRERLHFPPPPSTCHFLKAPWNKRHLCVEVNLRGPLRMHLFAFLNHWHCKIELRAEKPHLVLDVQRHGETQWARMVPTGDPRPQAGSTFLWSSLSLPLTPAGATQAKEEVK